MTPAGLALFKAHSPCICTTFKLTAAKWVTVLENDTGKFNALRGTLLEKSSLSHQVVTSNTRIIQIDTTIDDQSGERQIHARPFIRGRRA